MVILKPSSSSDNQTNLSVDRTCRAGRISSEENQVWGQGEVPSAPYFICISGEVLVGALQVVNSLRQIPLQDLNRIAASIL